jgi:hypothetical protein
MGRTDLPPEPGLAVFGRSHNDRLASVRIYDDADRPLSPKRGGSDELDD